MRRVGFGYLCFETLLSGRATAQFWGCAPARSNMTTLVPMTEAVFAAYVEESIHSYAEEKVVARLWSPAESIELSRKSFAELLPNGLATKDHYLFSIRDTTEAVTVGMLWIAAQERAGGRIAYIYDVSVRLEHQRKGYATRAFAALEEEVRRLGLSGIALNVFGHNAGAHSLYQKLGYRPTHINMYKAIGPIVG